MGAARSDEIPLSFYKDSGNIVTLIITQDGEILQDLSFITRAILRLPGQDLDSDVLSTDIWWTETVPRAINGITVEVKVLKLRLGEHITLPPGKYPSTRLVFFDGTYPAGGVWMDNITVEVK